MPGPANTLSPVYTIANEYVEESAALDPIRASVAGIAGHDVEMTDYSPEGAARLAALQRRTLASLAKAPIESNRDRIARDALREQLEVWLDEFEAGTFRSDLSVIRAPVTVIKRAFELMPRETESDWRNIVARLRLVPQGLASVEQSLEDGLRRGEAAARRQALDNIRQAETWAGETAGQPSAFEGLVASFETSAVGPEQLAADLRAAVLMANSAYSGFARFLRERYLDSAPERDGVGRDRYELGSRAMNGAVLDLDETYAWGWDELRRIEAAMADVAERISPGESITEVMARLDNDAAQCIKGVVAYRDWLQNVHDTAIADLHGVHFEIPEAIRRIEVVIPPPGGQLAASYTPPSEDFTRPGRTWWPIPEGQSRFPMWRDVTTAYHEGVPGHHLQVATAKYLADELPRSQRALRPIPGYVEGWALYAERLMGELGYFENPKYLLGMLRAQAMRAVRVVVDIGMHLELRIPEDEVFHPGETWTAELGEELLRTRGQTPAARAKSEITRYLGTPGQAISYKVGERYWLEAREAARESRGHAFDLKAWHGEALSLGPMGLAQMQRELAAL